MNQHATELAGSSKDLPMGVNKLSFSSFIADFLKELSSPAGARFAKEQSRWEASGENLLINAKQKQQGSELTWGAEEISWSMLSEISPHLFSHQASCQDVMASESPAEICLPSALLIHSSARLTLLITPALNHTGSAVTFWLYLLHQRHSMQAEFLQQFLQA